ncbi:MAG TPA: sialate O-acetylesterase [Bacillota bacterium]|nr:sialate O-acetylesterase [Bacillota bacterium]
MRPTTVYMSRLIQTGCVCAALTAFSAVSPSPGTRANLPWDWSGIIGTGQSLSVGARGVPVLSTNQPYGNLKLSTGSLPWPVDPNDTHLVLVPLVEPVGRLAPNYPSSWPENIDGETPHSAMANQLTALVRANLERDFVSVHGAVGEDGQGMVHLRKNPVRKGLNGHSYDAALIETKTITRLAKAASKTYGVGAILVTHGEADAGNPNYENELYRLWSDYNSDLPAITGQKQQVQMIVSQQNSCNDRSPSALAQWKVGVDYPEAIVCSGPKYQYPSTEGVHLTADGYRQMGEKYAQIYYERVILGKNWQPLQPTKAERDGPVITVHYHVPVPPLVWETCFEAPHQSVEEWKQGKGFEVSTSSGARVAITSVAISGNAVMITCASDPGAGARVGYALVGEKKRMSVPFAGTFRWGLLRDSDAFKGAGTGAVQPNYAVAFEMTVP